jgi:predicted transcriptional regulator
MGHSNQGAVWITLQTHKNIMAIASLKDHAAIILVKGLKPDDDTLATSNEEKIPILGTDLQTFEITGKVYQLINKQ